MPTHNLKTETWGNMQLADTEEREDFARGIFANFGSRLRCRKFN